MTKADIVSQISDQTGMEKGDVQVTVEAFMRAVRNNLESGENVYLRGFGSFVVKTRAAKTGRNILAKKAIQIPAHNIPSFKPSKDFCGECEAQRQGQVRSTCRCQNPRLCCWRVQVRSLQACC